MPPVAFKKRLLTCVASWPVSVKTEFQRYLRQLNQEAPETVRARRRRAELPYWLRLPAWLRERYNQTRPQRPLSSAFLQDILWAQYCLFLSVRIKDDVFDRQTDRPELLFVGDRLLSESVRVFFAVLENADSFRKLFWDLLEATNRGIVAVSQVQRCPSPSLSELAAGYAAVSSIFKLGSAAVCFKAHRTRDLLWIETYADSLAVVGQVLDDIEDIREDLDQGRCNYAAASLLGSDFEGTITVQAESRIARNALYTNAFGNLIRALDGRLLAAEVASKALALPAATLQVKKFRRSLAAAARRFHRSRVEQVFKWKPC